MDADSDKLAQETAPVIGGDNKGERVKFFNLLSISFRQFSVR